MPNAVSLCGPGCPNQGKQKSLCTKYGGSAMCGPECPNEGKRKSRCVICGGAELCTGCHLTPVKRKGTMCSACSE